ncbi:MAG: hypothetical protein HOQ09_06775 [Gemmatimonadaceae bacterium]|nr:hypothetical protein [Gemmatimonadaceae bacterium]
MGSASNAELRQLHSATSTPTPTLLSNGKLTRRRFLALSGAAATVVAADALLVEPRRLTVTRHLVRSPGAPVGARRVRIVQLTDLHLTPIGPFHERIAREIAHADPHLIVISGDSIDRPDANGRLDDFLSLLDPATPKFATWGNWEHYLGIDLGTTAEVYARHGCRVLDNASAVVHVNGARLLVTGIDSSQDGFPDITRALRGVEPSPNHLVIAHCPVQRDHVVRHIIAGPACPAPGAKPSAMPVTGPSLPHRPSLVLSGHTHGGQVTLGGWAPITPAGSGPYVAGWYRHGVIPLYVSRGIGETMIPLRFWCPPEVAVFEWEMA